ncbi:MAG: hypothetical protein JWN34_299, partial [Bryobacterales bacterium]|nr:hypothetical protein [Bryobacterales bacterium]
MTQSSVLLGTKGQLRRYLVAGVSRNRLVPHVKNSRCTASSRLLKNKTSNLGAQKDAWILCAAQTYTKTSCSVMA